MAKKPLLPAMFFLLSTTGYAQAPPVYSEWVRKAMAFYDNKQYQESANAFTQAFASYGGMGYVDDRYNAACAWARAGNNDSAFYNLNRLATRVNYSDYSHLTTDPDLENLHGDNRWAKLCTHVKQNKDKAEANLNKPLVAMLDTIFIKDQANRLKIDGITQRSGRNSKEMKDLWTIIKHDDSLDQLKIIALLDKYGWLGPDVVGIQGSQTIFLVIQHADITIQDKYLPLMREAVKNKKAEPSSLAMLEDRTALRHGKKQIYGSQIHLEPDGTNWLSPLEDPDNVDKRRQEVGLGPLADYLNHWHLKWDAAEYKKQLPEIEWKEKNFQN